MPCCKCNCSGHCRNCSCIKDGGTCQGCLPQSLGNCANVQILQPQPSQHSSAGLDYSPSSLQSPQDAATQPPPALQPLDFSWGSCSGEVLYAKVNLAHDEVVHWQQNLLQVLSGSSGKAFVSELAHPVQAYADSSRMHSNKGYLPNADPPPSKALKLEDLISKITQDGEPYNEHPKTFS